MEARWAVSSNPISLSCLFNIISVPFLALARTFCEIQKTRARLMQIELLRDFLICVIVQNSTDLIGCVSLASNQVRYLTTISKAKSYWHFPDVAFPALRRSWTRSRWIYYYQGHYRSYRPIQANDHRRLQKARWLGFGSTGLRTQRAHACSAQATDCTERCSQSQSYC